MRDRKTRITIFHSITYPKQEKIYIIKNEKQTNISNPLKKKKKKYLKIAPKNTL